MTDLLERSAAYLDGGPAQGETNPMTLEVSELADDVAMVASFSHVVSVRTDDGLLLFDATLPTLADQAVASLRRWCDDPVRTLVYTHGHLDHVGGGTTFVAEAEARGRRRPDIVAHEAVPERFRRYELTRGWQQAINQRQFGGGRRGGDGVLRFESDWAEPSTTYAERLTLDVGGVPVELHHDRGETDDHTWAWLPRQRALAVGDFVIWCFPNAGNPQKVQRYPREWAKALRSMVALEPELLLPAHGLPVAGRERIRRMLDEQAEALESIVDQTLALMNDGETLDAIVHQVRVPERLLDRPHLQPVYDEPEFVVRNVWRQFGGWWDGDPSHLKPAPASALAGELASLVGGSERLAQRAAELSEADDHRLACHLAELAVQADPESRAAHAARAAVYRARRQAERSLMAKGIYGGAAATSEEVIAPADPSDPDR